MPIRSVMAALCVVVLGCALGDQSATRGGGIRLDRTIEFDGADSEDLLYLQPRPADVGLLDPSRNTLASFRIQDGHLVGTATKTSPAVFVAPAKADDHGFQLLDAVGGTVLYWLRSELDGDVRLDDGKEQTLYEIKLRDYGLKVEQGDGELQAKVRVKGEKISVRGPDGKTVFTTRDPIPASMAACLTMNELPLTFRVGLALAILHWGEDSL